MSTSEAEAATAATWDALPDALALRILSLLPVDTRLRCSEVRRHWRRLLAAGSAAWARLDLSATAGIAGVVTAALVKAAVARAGGRLDRSGCQLVHLSHGANHDD
jgi:hypothetical protein